MIQIETIKETKEQSYTTKQYLISAIIMVVLGGIIFSNPSSVIKFISYVLAVLSIGYGCFRIYSYTKLNNKNDDLKYMLLASGLIFILIGILLIVFSNAIEVIIRITLGIWILFSGINQLVFAIPGIKTKDSYIPLIFSVILILCGLYMILVSNIIFGMIGLIILIYGILKIAMFVYYSQKNIDKKSKEKIKTVKSKNIKNVKKSKNKKKK